MKQQKRKLTKIEQETIISFNDSEQGANYYTCNYKDIAKLEKLCLENSTIYRGCEEQYSKSYMFPKVWIKISPPRQLSDKRRQVLFEQMRIINENKKAI